MIIFKFSTCQMKTSSKKYRTFFGSSRFLFNNMTKITIQLKILKAKMLDQSYYVGGVINSTNTGGSFSKSHRPSASIVKSEKRKNPNRWFDDPRCKVGKPEELWYLFCAEIWSDYLEGSCWILLNIYSFVTIIQRKTWWISNAFHVLYLQSKLMRTWRPGYFKLQNV